MRITRVAAVPLAAALLLAAVGAQAQSTPALITEGRTLAKDGQLEAALRKFEAAAAIGGPDVALIDVAEVRERLGQFEAAARGYERFVQAPPAGSSDKQVRAAREKLEAILPRLGFIAFECPVEGVSVSVDQVLVGKTPLAPVRVDTGRREIRAWRAGEPDVTTFVLVKAASTARVELDFTPPIGSRVAGAVAAGSGGDQRTAPAPKAQPAVARQAATARRAPELPFGPSPRVLPGSPPAPVVAEAPAAPPTEAPAPRAAASPPSPSPITTTAPEPSILAAAPAGEPTPAPPTAAAPPAAAPAAASTGAAPAAAAAGAATAVAATGAATAVAAPAAAAPAVAAPAAAAPVAAATAAPPAAATAVAPAGKPGAPASAGTPVPAPPPGSLAADSDRGSTPGPTAPRPDDRAAPRPDDRAAPRPDDRAAAAASPAPHPGDPTAPPATAVAADPTPPLDAPPVAAPARDDDPAFYESPWLWLVTGAVVTAGVVIGVAATTGGDDFVPSGELGRTSTGDWQQFLRGPR